MSKIDFLQKFNETLIKTFLFSIKFATLQISLFVSFFISSQTLVSNLFVLFAIYFATSINQILFTTFLVTSKRFYLIMNDLFALFNKKLRFSNLLHYQNNVLFSSIKRFNNFAFFVFQIRMFIISQTRITLYFKLISNNDQKENEIKA